MFNLSIRLYRIGDQGFLFLYGGFFKLSTKKLVKAGLSAILELKRVGVGVEVQEKSAGDYSSSEDLASDTAMAELARVLYPEIEVFSEESCNCGETLPANCIVIDPLDGSNNRVRARDAWGISAAVIQNYEPVEATAFVSYHGKRLVFHAKKGQGLFCRKLGSRDWKRVTLSQSWDGTRISVPGSPKAAKTKLASSYHRFLDENSLWRSSVCEGCALANTTGLILNSVDVYVNAATGSVLDVAAPQLFIQEAGGFVCDHMGDSPKWQVSWQPVILARKQEFAKRFIMG